MDRVKPDLDSYELCGFWTGPDRVIPIDTPIQYIFNVKHKRELN